MKTLLVVIAFLTGCATTKPAVTAVAPPDPTSPEAAKAVVGSALQALKSGDSVAFRALLSADRAREYTPAYFSLWSSEIRPAQLWQIDAFEPGDGGTARVKVTLSFGRSKQEASIRLRLEGGRWRWAER